MDVDLLVSEVATVEEEDLPVDADAITLHLKDPERRPQIIINRKRARPATRKRFTLAHELGHILIPWHVGTMTVSHIGYRRFINPLYAKMEAEANRFASELLMPSGWLTALIKDLADVKAVHEYVAATARVSHTTSAFALAQRLPIDFAFVEVEDGTGEVKFCGQSPNTWVNLPTIGEVLRGSPFPTAHAVGIVPTSHSTIYWGDFSEHTPLSAEPATPTESDWRGILDGIFADLGLPEEEIKAKKMSVSGIVGSANPRVPSRTVDAIVHTFRTRFAGRPELHDLVTHKSFSLFLRLRAENILSAEAARRGSRPTGR